MLARHLSNHIGLSTTLNLRVAICCSLIIMLSACSGHKAVAPGTIPALEFGSFHSEAEALPIVKSFSEQNNYPLVTTKKESQRVGNVLKRLAKALGAPENKVWPHYVVDAGDEVNAAAINKQLIVVYKAMLDKVKSDDQLATVLAHEVAHIVAKHGDDENLAEKTGWINATGMALGTAASVAVSVAGGGSGLADLAGDSTATATGMIGYGGFIQSYSRAQEYEADQIGLMIMAKAGYNPDIAIDFWKNAKEIFGGSGGFAFFSTHPSESDRVSELEEVMPIARKYYEESGKRGRS